MAREPLVPSRGARRAVVAVGVPSGAGAVAHEARTLTVTSRRDERPGGMRMLARQAKTLQDRYGDLLRPDSSFHRPLANEAWDRLEQARRRRTGREPSPQMTLELPR